MAMPLFLDASVLDLLAAHVLGDQPMPAHHEWAVDDLRFMLERFEGQLSVLAAFPLRAEHAAALARVAERYQVPHQVLAPASAEAARVAALMDAGVPAAQAPFVAACAQQEVRLFVQADEPDDAYRDRVLRVCDVYIVDPMNCLSHLHARLMGRDTL